VSLILRRIYWDDGKPSMDPEGYSVIADGKAVGRIYRTLAPGGQRMALEHLDEATGIPVIETAFKAAWQARE
jgi:hypothetical protein